MTVAAVVERDGLYLVVEEMADGQRVYNQPAGHLEPGETLHDAVIREVLEETGCHFEPKSVIGIYRWENPASRETHVRVAFAGTINGSEPEARLDTPIIAPHWLTYDEVQALDGSLRSPLVLGCIEDFRSGTRHSLSLLRDMG